MHNYNDTKQVLSHLTGNYLAAREQDKPAMDSHSYEHLELNLPEELVTATPENSEQDFSTLAQELQAAQDTISQQFIEREQKLEQKTLTIEDLLQDRKSLVPVTFQCESLPYTLELFSLIPTVSQNFKVISGYNSFLGDYSKLIDKQIKLIENGNKEDNNVIAQLAELTTTIVQYVEQNFYLLKPTFALLCRANGVRLTEQDLEFLLSKLNPSDYFKLADCILGAVSRGKFTK